jgi:hypothetical protein
MTPREYTLHRIILLGIEIKGREGRDDYRVQALRSLYLALKTDPGDASPHVTIARKGFSGLDLLHLDRILVDEKSIVQLTQRR